VITPSPHSLIVQPGTGTGAASAEGEAAQGPLPSLIDYSLEVEADFPMDVLSTMKENATKKTRRIVIGRTLGGRATLKSLLHYFKLHLPIPLVSITLLTRGLLRGTVQRRRRCQSHQTPSGGRVEWPKSFILALRPKFRCELPRSRIAPHPRNQGSLTSMRSSRIPEL